MVLGIFPKSSFQVIKSQVKLPKCLISHTEISQKVRLGPSAIGPSAAARIGWSAEHCGYKWLGGRKLWVGQTLEVATQEIAHLISCHLGRYPWDIGA